MASALKNLSSYKEENIIDAKSYSFGIAVSDWNEDITHKLYEGCFDTLVKHGALQKNIVTLQVPGTFELPTAAKNMISAKKLDAVICIGCVIQGETKHNDYINQAVATSLAQLGMTTGTPVIFGVLTPNDHQQALDRSGGKYGNKGVEAGVTALRMLEAKAKLTADDSKIGF